MFTDSEVAACLLTWAEHGAATIVRLKGENQDLREQVEANQQLKQDNQDLREEIEAMKMLMSPPALIPISDVPCRVVTGIEMESEPE